MSINLSYPQMLEEDFESFVLGTLDSFHVPYENITLEVTETYLIEQDSIVHDIMGRLQEKGIQSAMDDFGMGYSSLFELRGQRAHGGKIPAGIVETPNRRRNGKKMHAGEVKEQQGPACTRREIARHHRRDVQGGGETGRKMHAGGQSSKYM